MDVIIDVSNLILENDLYKLRIFNKNDLLDLFEYASVSGVGESAGWKHHESLEDSVNFLNCYIMDKNVLAIVDKLNNKVIGSFSFQKINKECFNNFNDYKCVEIGYTLSKVYWNKGIMTSLLGLVMNYLKDIDIDYILARCYLDNIGSKKVLERNNFKQYETTNDFLLFYNYNKA